MFTYLRWFCYENEGGNIFNLLLAEFIWNNLYSILCQFTSLLSCHRIDRINAISSLIAVFHWRVSEAWTAERNSHLWPDFMTGSVDRWQDLHSETQAAECISRSQCNWFTDRWQNLQLLQTHHSNSNYYPYTPHPVAEVAEVTCSKYIYFAFMLKCEGGQFVPNRKYSQIVIFIDASLFINLLLEPRILLDNLTTDWN